MNDAGCGKLCAGKPPGQIAGSWVSSGCLSKAKQSPFATGGDKIEHLYLHHFVQFGAI
jgi:hypothetical protein